MENQKPERDPINRVPSEENVVVVSNYNVNAFETNEGNKLIILQEIHNPSGSIDTVGLPISDRAELELFIDDLKRIANLLWPTPGESNAHAKDGDSQSDPSKTTIRKTRTGDKPGEENPG